MRGAIYNTRNEDDVTSTKSNAFVCLHHARVPFVCHSRLDLITVFMFVGASPYSFVLMRFRYFLQGPLSLFWSNKVDVIFLRCPPPFRKHQNSYPVLPTFSHQITASLVVNVIAGELLGEEVNKGESSLCKHSNMLEHRSHSLMEKRREENNECL